MADKNKLAKDIVNATNNCFKELCKTLESQQMRLMALSKRRLLLAQEVSDLRKAVEKEQTLSKKITPKDKHKEEGKVQKVKTVFITTDGPTCRILNNKGVQTDPLLENQLNISTVAKATKTKGEPINEEELQKQEEKLQHDIKVNLSTMNADVTALLNAVVKASHSTTSAKADTTSSLNIVDKSSYPTTSVENK